MPYRLVKAASHLRVFICLHVLDIFISGCSWSAWFAAFYHSFTDLLYKHDRAPQCVCDAIHSLSDFLGRKSEVLIFISSVSIFSSSAKLLMKLLESSNLASVFTTRRKVPFAAPLTPNCLHFYILLVGLAFVPELTNLQAFITNPNYRWSSHPGRIYCSISPGYLCCETDFMLHCTLEGVSCGQQDGKWLLAWWANALLLNARHSEIDWFYIPCSTWHLCRL